MHETGDYEVRLRRWPESADLPIDAALPPGDPVPGSKAFRMTPGKAISPSRATLKIGELSAEAPVKAGDKEVVFNVRLVQGKTRMAALFIAPKAETGAQSTPFHLFIPFPCLQATIFSPDKERQHRTRIQNGRVLDLAAAKGYITGRYLQD